MPGTSTMLAWSTDMTSDVPIRLRTEEAGYTAEPGQHLLPQKNGVEATSFRVSEFPEEWHILGHHRGSKVTRCASSRGHGNDILDQTAAPYLHVGRSVEDTSD